MLTGFFVFFSLINPSCKLRHFEFRTVTLKVWMTRSCDLFSRVDFRYR